jgi:hypothetical protein
VYWDKPHKKWRVQARDKGKKKYLGLYDDETAAARAFDAYVIANKINADLNFPSAPGAAWHMTTKKGRTSSYRGVCWAKSKKKWQANIMVDGKKKYLGRFVDKDDAGRAYDAAVRKHYPDERPHGWKRFNFPSADGEEGSADGGDYTGSARGGASNSSSSSSSVATVDARAEEEEAPPCRHRRRHHRDTRTVAEARADDNPFYALLRAAYSKR